MKYRIREMNRAEYPLLEKFLYEAIFIPKGAIPPPQTIIELPELQVYIKNFGAEISDKALVAEVDGNIVGVVWVRIMNDYGHIDNETPSLAISIYKEYRGFGIGTNLVKGMLSWLKENGYARASLSVQKENFAIKLYQNVGFKIIDENNNEYIMAVSL